MSFPVTLLLVCGILITVVLIPLLICRMLFLNRKANEFEKFSRENEETVWIEGNPLYKEPISSFHNPMYRETPC